MKSLRPSSILSVLALLTCTATPAFSAIILTFPTATETGSLVITQDINFTITAADAVSYLVFDEWVTNDGGRNSFLSSAMTPWTLAYSVNSGTTRKASIGLFSDNISGVDGPMTENDGYIYLSTSPILRVNDIFTVKAATYTLAANSLPANFNPQTQQTFTGNAFLSTSTVRLSANTPVGAAVPEPGSLGLLALGALAAATRRRRRAAGV